MNEARIAQASGLAELTLRSDPKQPQSYRYRPTMTWIARHRPTAVDCVVTSALTLSSQAEIWAPRLVPGVGEVTGSAPLLAVTALAMTLPLALRRTSPLAVLVMVFGAAALQGWLTQPIEGLSALAAMLIAAYASSAFTGPSKAVVGAVTLLVGIALGGPCSGTGNSTRRSVLAAAALMELAVAATVVGTV